MVERAPLEHVAGAHLRIVRVLLVVINIEAVLDGHVEPASHPRAPLKNKAVHAGRVGVEHLVHVIEAVLHVLHKEAGSLRLRVVTLIENVGDKLVHGPHVRVESQREVAVGYLDFVSHLGVRHVGPGHVEEFLELRVRVPRVVTDQIVYNQYIYALIWFAHGVDRSFA